MSPIGIAWSASMENYQHFILSPACVLPFIAARQACEEAATTTLDLGLTTSLVSLDEHGVSLPDGQRLTWAQIEEIAGADSGCFAVQENAIRKVQFFSEEFNRFYSLMPTAGAPTMLLAGFPMHRIKEVDPHED